MPDLSVPSLAYDSKAENIGSLVLIQKYCTREACFGKSKPDETLSLMYDQVSKMISTKLSERKASDEDVVTAASKMMLILNNANLSTREARKRKAESSVSYRQADYSAEGASRYLSEYWAKTQFQKEAAKDIKSRFLKRNMYLLGLLSVASIAGVITSCMQYLDAKMKHDEPSADYTWWEKLKHRFGQPLPQSNAEKYGPSMQSAKVCLIVTAILLLILLVLLILSIRSRKRFIAKQAELLQAGSDFQRLLKVFSKTERMMTEG